MKPDRKNGNVFNRKRVVKSVNLQGLVEVGGKAAESLQSDNVLEESGARRLAAAPWSINFRRTDGILEARGRDLVP